MYLEKINNPEDVKKLDATGRQGLVDEIRAALLSRASKHGGHFGPNFGMVEATVALHTVFDSPHDHIVYDVSHQTYPHKMLTGRKEAFTDPEHYDDVSPYTDPDETPHDLFKIGHTSTSISLALGLAKARDLRGGHENIIAVIGDGSMSGGEALEGLNVAGELDSNFIIVFNDNQRSIAENHGGMYDRFKELRESNGAAPDNLFKAMGLDYVYVNDGNDTEALIAAFKQVKDIDHPVVVHINTLKGKGYEPALKDEEAWHWHGPFDIATGQSLSDGPAPESYANLAGEYLLKRAETDENLLVVASAVPFALGMSPERRERMGKHYLDVGIAEETAVAIASGAAHAGAHVVWGSSTTFQQRVYDQLSQDLALNGNPAVIVGNSGSVWGMSDVTHASLWTIPMIANIPNITYLAPTNAEEYLAMLHWGLDQEKHPVFIQVPGGPVRHAKGPVRKFYDDLRSEVVRRGSKIAIFGLGSFFDMGEKTADILRESLGFEVTLVNPLFASGLDGELLDNLAVNHDIFVTLEDGQLEGGWGQTLASYFGNSDKHVLNYGIKKDFYDRFKADKLLHENRLEPGLIVADIRAVLQRCGN
ncbi:1-deoxy-D-xylulose-5-phosphate synthase [Lancefieldella rimae]|uniref:1-deoxy-D-xylulose-5-phosphate synthase n=1 Tax=Lancefieldella rimae TaxID=1383 RepID=UPI0028EB7473|nr:1-deoxy-D-xylulose-5-phosphate synthase [Lancefieldella rimae]